MTRSPGLRVVRAADQFTGAALPAFERAGKLARPGDATHRGLLMIAVTLARFAVRACSPPGSNALLLEGLDLTEGWAERGNDPERLARLRNDAFNSVVAVERKTVEAVASATKQLARGAPTLLDEHADLVVCRYAGLAANYAAGAALLTMDAVREPERVIGVPQQISGALAYQRVGLGPARSPELRASACEQAEWEHERQGAPPGHGVGGIAIQLFHEYLGARWKDQSDAERARADEFCRWALGPSLLD
ncbi:MAG: hypothetical protein OZ921_00010 [Sorangiineae bacterium]|nr:hypothetical protein [Polyangiaceae bacterium]MEB2320867.1 hypothetical protein [Sorangiineae bacterium]